jgi:ferric-dicitrate binding protein FerR (iron transport regulator)
MAKGPKHEPEVTDLARYRKAKANAAKRKAAKPPKPPKPPRQSFLGSNPRAGLILVVVVVVMLALWLGPRFL